MKSPKVYWRDSGLLHSLLEAGRLLKTSPQSWMRLPADWDLHEAMKREARAAS